MSGQHYEANIALAMAHLGALPTSRLPVLWRFMRVEKVQWDGCMAHIRNVIDSGRIVSREKQRRGQPIEGFYVQYEKSGLQFEPAAHLRIIGKWPHRKLEFWN